MRKLIGTIAVFIILACGVAYANPPDFIPPGHRCGGDGGDATAVAIAGINWKQSVKLDQTQLNVQLNEQNINVPDKLKVRMPVKWHDSEINPRDPAYYEGPWEEDYNNNRAIPWLMKESWTNEEVSNFPQEKVKVISALYKKGKVTNNVTFTRPGTGEHGINRAGTIRFTCKSPECTVESLHRRAVETAHANGIRYMVPIAIGAIASKTGGDWSARLGGGGGGITGDGGVSGGGGIGGGKYWVAPVMMPWVIFECWVYIDEVSYYNK